MKNCGLENVIIGSKSVPADDVVTALKAVTSIKNIDEAIAKSYAKLNAKVTPKAWDEWFRNQYDLASTAVNEGNILKEDESDKTTIKTAKQLINLINKKRKLSKEASRLLNSIRANIKRSEGLNLAQIRDINNKVRKVLGLDSMRKSAAKMQARGLKRVKGKLAVTPEQKELFEILLNVDPEKVPIKYLDKYLNVMEQIGSASKTPVFSKTIFQDTADLVNVLHKLTPDASVEVSKPKGLNDEMVRNMYLYQINNIKILPAKGTTRARREFLDNINTITEEELESLSTPELKTYLLEIRNLEAGIGVGNPMYKIWQKVDSNRVSNNVVNAFKNNKQTNFFVNGVSDLLNKIGAALQKNKTKESVAVHGITTRVIDNVLGLKGNEVFNNTTERLAKAFSNADTAIREDIDTINTAEKTLFKANKLDNNKTVISKAKMYLYMLGIEKESNPDTKGVKDPLAVLEATIEFGKVAGRRITQKTSKLYQTEIYDKFVKNGELDLQALYNSLSDVEKKAIEEIAKVNAGNFGKVETLNKLYTDSNVALLNNYTFHNTLDEDGVLVEPTFKEFTTVANSPLAERSEKVSPMVLDPFLAGKRMVSKVNRAYYLTPEVEIVLAGLKNALENNKDNNGIAAVSEITLNMVEVVYSSATNEENNVDWFIRQGRRSASSMLIGSVRKLISELFGHLAWISGAPQQVLKAAGKYRGMAIDESSYKILDNMNSFQTAKLYDADLSHGSFAEREVGFTDTQGNPEASTAFWNSVNQKKAYIKKYTSDASGKLTEKFYNTTIAGADKIFSRPLWFASADLEFKKITGEDINWGKIKVNDEAYMRKHKEAIEAARQVADEETAKATNTSNPFVATAKFQVARGQGLSTQAKKAFNGFMLSFNLGEWATTKQAIAGLVGDGSMSRARAIGILAAVHLRMSLYSAMMLTLGQLMFQWDEGEEEEAIYDTFMRYLVGSFATSFLGRNFGMIPRAIVSLGIEEINKQYLGFLRNEQEYDKFKHSMVFSLIDPAFFKDYNNSLADFVAGNAGWGTVLYKPLDRIRKDFRTATTAKNPIKREEAVERLLYRIPFTAAALTRRIPYKDINQKMNQIEYND